MHLIRHCPTQVVPAICASEIANACADDHRAPSAECLRRVNSDGGYSFQEVFCKHRCSLREMSRTSPKILSYEDAKQSWWFSVPFNTKMRGQI